MKKKQPKKILKKNSFKLFIILLLLSGCKDTLQRFSYQNFECQNNDFGIQKIWITKKQNNSKGQILIKDEELNLNLLNSTEKVTVYEIEKKNLKIEISRKTDVIKGIYRNNIFSIYCVKKSFKM